MPPTEFRLNRRPEDNTTTGTCAKCRATDVPVLKSGVPFHYWETLGDGDCPPICLECVAQGRIGTSIGKNNRAAIERHLGQQPRPLPPTLRGRKLDEITAELDRTPPPPAGQAVLPPWPMHGGDACAYAGQPKTMTGVVALAGGELTREQYVAMIADAATVQGLDASLQNRIATLWPEGLSAPGEPFPEGAHDPSLLVFVSPLDGTAYVRVDMT